MEQDFITFSEDLRQEYSRTAARSGESSAFLSLDGNLICLRMAEDGPGRLLMPSLSGCAVSEPQGKPDITIYLWRQELDRYPALAHLRQIRDKVSVANRATAHLLYNPAGEILSFIDTDSREAFYCTGDPGALPDYEICTPMRMLLHWCCFRFGLIFVHAAAVEHMGRGALLIGRGGSGKSTTALACLLHGLGFTGDDYVAIAPGNPPRALSLYRGCKLTEEMLPRFPSLRRLEAEVNHTGDKHVILLRPESGVLLRETPVETVLQCVVTRGKNTCFRSSAPLTALMEMATSTVLQTQGGGEYTLRGLTEFMRTQSPYILELGTDFEEIAESMKRFLGDTEEGRRRFDTA